MKWAKDLFFNAWYAGVYKNFDKSCLFKNSTKCFQVCRGMWEYQRLYWNWTEKLCYYGKFICLKIIFHWGSILLYCMYTIFYICLVFFFLTFTKFKFVVILFLPLIYIFWLRNKKGCNIQISKIMFLTLKKLLQSYT